MYRSKAMSQYIVIIITLHHVHFTTHMKQRYTDKLFITIMTPLPTY